MGFPRQGFQSELPLPSPDDLSDPGIVPASAALQADSSQLSHLGRVYSENKGNYLEQKTGSKSQLSNIITFIFGDFPVGSDGKESACIAGDPGSIPVSGRTPGVGNGSSVPYFCPENSTDRVLGRLQSMGLQSLTRLSNLHTHTHTHTHTVSAFRHTAVTKVQKSEG